VNVHRRSFTVALIVFPILAVVILFGTAAGAQPPANMSLSGAWTLNADLSDRLPGRSDDVDAERGRRSGGRGAGGGGRGMGRGGFGGGGMGRGRAAVNPEDAARTRQAMRDIIEPSDHLTITEAGSMIVITSADGRTTRLSTDGKKVKDENTKIERKTRWEAGKLVSEISGSGRGKVTQTLAIDSEGRQLRIIAQVDGGRGGQPRTITHVYDRDER
jgi:hypothetical protein